MTVVELDDKGRALLPASVRKKMGTRRFEVKVVKGKIELTPLEDVRELKGKYANLIRSSWTEIEEKAERFVRQGKR
jgi:bifunctional DNA-binding transcriptional regulator/antitoxin component of YhaV-PrlF toxin-antitoxin module